MKSTEDKKDFHDGLMDDEAQMEMRQLITEALLIGKGRNDNAEKEWDRFALKSGIRKQLFDMKYLLRIAACISVLLISLTGMWLFQAQQDKKLVVYAAKAESDKIIITSGNTSIVVKKDSIEINQGNKPVEWQTITVPPTKDFHLHLPDGSKVWLNANAVLSYPTRFGNIREVKLEGEAYFDVVSDPSHPFVVTTGDIATRVVGTEFNVKYVKSDVPCITLVSGRVDIDDLAGNKLAELYPNESAEVNSGVVSKQEVYVEDKICWREGIEMFENDTLEDILIRIGSWYNMSVVCHDIPELNCRYHFIYDRRSDVQDAVKMLSEISKLKIKIEKNTIFVD